MTWALNSLLTLQLFGRILVSPQCPQQYQGLLCEQGGLQGGGLAIPMHILLEVSDSLAWPP